MREIPTATRDDEPRRITTGPLMPERPGGAITSSLMTPPTEDENATASFRDVIGNRPFRSLWIAQICSQLAQNLTWITLGAFVANQTHKNTLVSVIIVSAMLAQVFLSGFAG